MNNEDLMSQSLEKIQKRLEETLKMLQGLDEIPSKVYELLPITKLAGIIPKLDEIQSAVYSSKTLLTFKEGCKYLGISESYCYKLTAAESLPFFKSGKLIYFDRLQLEQWAKRNPIIPRQTLSAKAVSFVNSKTAKP